MLYTAAINGVFAFLIAGGLLFTKSGVTPEFLLNLLFYIIITPVIALTLTKTMQMSENKMIVADALSCIDSVLNAEPVSASDEPQHPKDGSVKLFDVHFSYDGETEVIKGVSMDIKSGQTVALVGPSGGGKSTLASLMCRFFDVQSGSISIGCADVREIPKEELMDTVSFVFQNSRLIKGSILDNVKLGRPEATEEEVLAALRAAQCMDIIEKFPDGIHTVIGTKGVYLSGGEQQRIAIARAMLKNAPVLILDEATAFADPDNEAKVQAAFQEYIETIRDLKASNAEGAYLRGLSEKIRAVEKQTMSAELTNAVFVTSAGMVLKLGIASVALTGSVLLINGSIDVLTLFMFLLVASRLYDPMQGALNNLAAVIAMRTNVARMNEILEYPTQTGSDELTNQGCDIVFDHVGFAYNSGETVLRDVSFTAKQGEVTALVGPSGGGKTTVSRLAARFWDHEKGSITVGGMDISKVDPEKLMGLYSIVF